MNTTIQNTTKYKNSPLGLIPEDWEVKRFGEISKVNQGLQIPIEERLIEETENSFKYITIQYLNNAKNVEYILNPTQSVLCNEDDVLMTRTGNTGIVVSDVAGVFHNNFFKINFDRNSINKVFLINYLRSKKTQHTLLIKAGVGTIPDLNHKDFYSIYLPIPALPEQAAMADCLSTWDKAIEKQQALIAQKELSKKALGHKLLTGKLRIKEFENQNWIEIKADKIFRNNTDKSHNGELEILSASQERGILPRRLNNIDIKYDENSLSSYKKVEIGDYVISLRSFQGGIEYSEYEGIVSPAYTILKEIIPISKVFYKVYFKTETFINRLNTIIYGIRDGKQISFKDFATLKIPYPSIEEQSAIANVLQCADDELQLLKKKLEQLKEQKKGLMQVLLTGKKRLKY